MPNENSFETLRGITGDENLLVLVPSPGDESLLCGGLIAESCARGRPPVVVVLADASGSHNTAASHTPGQIAALRTAALCAQETRLACSRLGLPDGRLLLAGLHHGTIPHQGCIFDTIVEALILVMWARDCNIVCAPWPRDAAGDDWAAHRIATEIAARSGVGHLAIPDREAPGCQRLDIRRRLAAKSSAIAAHATRRGSASAPTPQAASMPATPPPFEIFLTPDRA